MRLEELKLDGEYLKDITISELSALPFSLCSHKDGMAILIHIGADGDWVLTIAIPTELVRELLTPDITVEEISKHQKVVYKIIKTSRKSNE